jgi:hypothetical protein
VAVLAEYELSDMKQALKLRPEDCQGPGCESREDAEDDERVEKRVEKKGREEEVETMTQTRSEIYRAVCLPFANAVCTSSSAYVMHA